MWQWISSQINKIKINLANHHPSYIIKHAASFFIGFILSPVSWWNDIFVNVPLAWAMTWPILKMASYAVPVSKNLFLGLFIFNYWLTNIAGMMMMHWSGKKLINKDAKFDIALDLGVGLIYSIIIALIFITNPLEILDSLHIIPAWVK